jgi:hypothetical protein
VPTVAKTAPVLGAIQGCIEITPVVRERARAFASTYFKAQEAIEFSRDDVETFAPPDWAPKRRQWLPVAALRQWGLKAGSARLDQMIVTLGVDQHIDAAHGKTLCLVLHNEGLIFRQGRIAHPTAAGEWFIFDDRRAHGVRSAKGAAAYLALVIPLVDSQLS